LVATGDANLNPGGAGVWELPRHGVGRPFIGGQYEPHSGGKDPRMRRTCYRATEESEQFRDRRRAVDRRAGSRAKRDRAELSPVVIAVQISIRHIRERLMPDETTFELASIQFGTEPVAVFRFGYERFELRARLGPGNLEHAIAAAAEVAASVFARWSHEALAFAQRVRSGEEGGPVHH
jgi:hypothetical protein